MIIQQDDGLFCVFSTCDDTLHALDQTREQLIQQAGEQAKRQAEIETARIIDKLQNGESPYHQFGVSYLQALQRHQEHRANCNNGQFNREVNNRLNKLTNKPD